MTIEEILTATVRVAVREEVRTAVREALAQAKPAEASDYLSLIEAGRIAGVHPETVRLWIQQGRLPGHRAGRGWRVRRHELDAFLAATHDPSPESPEARAAAILNRGALARRRP